jgi:broad specificity polyphosphatase/5'/3'-nucleotidase SurE
MVVGSVREGSAGSLASISASWSSHQTSLEASSTIVEMARSLVRRLLSSLRGDFSSNIHHIASIPFPSRCQCRWESFRMLGMTASATIIASVAVATFDLGGSNRLFRRWEKKTLSRAFSA